VVARGGFSGSLAVGRGDNMAEPSWMGRRRVLRDWWNWRIATDAISYRSSRSNVTNNRVTATATVFHGVLLTTLCRQHSIQFVNTTRYFQSTFCEVFSTLVILTSLNFGAQSIWSPPSLCWCYRRDRQVKLFNTVLKYLRIGLVYYSFGYVQTEP